MKKLLILLFSASLFISCNNNKDQGGGLNGGLNNNNNNRGGWSNAEKNKFMNDCTGGGGNKQLCSCILGKLQTKYKNMQEADRVGGEAAGQQLAMECQQGGGGTDDNWNGNDGGDDNLNDNNGDDNNNGGGGFNRGGGNWSNGDKSKFMNDCINGGGTSQLCNCVLGKLQAKFKNMAEAERIGGAAAGEKLGQECRNQGDM